MLYYFHYIFLDRHGLVHSCNIDILILSTLSDYILKLYGMQAPPWPDGA